MADAPNTTQFYDKDGNPIQVVTMPAPQRENTPTDKFVEGTQNFFGAIGRFFRNIFSGSEGSVFWMFGRIIDGLKIVVESINRALAQQFGNNDDEDTADSTPPPSVDDVVARARQRRGTT